LSPSSLRRPPCIAPLVTHPLPCGYLYGASQPAGCDKVCGTTFLSHTAGRSHTCLLQRVRAPDTASLRAHAQVLVVRPDLPLHSPINRGMCDACPPHRHRLSSSVNCAAIVPYFPPFHRYQWQLTPATNSSHVQVSEELPIRTQLVMPTAPPPHHWSSAAPP
jgi:hypothetical protein